MDGTARRKTREALLYVTLDLAAGSAEDRAESTIEAELPVHVPNKVEGGEALLAFGQPQAAAELLEKDGGAFGGPEEEDGIDLRYVDALVEQIDGEDNVDFAVT